MVRYRRNFVPGGYFFTATLVDRTSSALVDHISALRAAFRIARRERPFAIDATVILPEHLHALWTLPSDDSDFSGRWNRIKSHFTHRLVAAGVPVKRHRSGEYGADPDFASLHLGYELSRTSLRKPDRSW